MIKRKQTVLDRLAKSSYPDFHDVPDEFLNDEEVILTAIELHPHCSLISRMSLRNDRICDALAVAGNLEDIPVDMRTEERCRTAVKAGTRHYFLPLKYTPKEFIDEEMCIYALRHSVASIDFVPEEYLTEKVLLEAIKAHPHVFRYIPESHKSEKVIKAAIKADGLNISGIPESKRTLSLCKLAVKNAEEGDDILRFIPEKYKNKKFYMFAVQCLGDLLCFVPDEYRDYDICKAAVLNSPEAVRYCPDNVILKAFSDAPSVVPQPKEGEWIADDDGDKKCSNCGEYAPLSFDDYYMRGGKIRQEENLLLCPYCGAKMKG